MADLQPGDEAAYRLTLESAKETLLTLALDPDAKPTFQDAFAYATVEHEKHQHAGAAAAYRAALAKVDQSNDPVKFRRVVTDNLSKSLRIPAILEGHVR